MARKSFKGDPVLQFLSAGAEQGPKLLPKIRETKNRRLQLLLRPGLYEKIFARATTSGESVNGLVHRLLETAMEADQRDQSVRSGSEQADNP